MLTILYLVLAAVLFNAFMSWQLYPGHDFFRQELAFGIVPAVGIVLLKWAKRSAMTVTDQGATRSAEPMVPEVADTPLARERDNSALNESAGEWLLAWLLSPYLVASLGLVVLLVLGAKSTWLPAGTTILTLPFAYQFPLVIPDPAQPHGPPIYLTADKFEEFRSRNPTASLVLEQAEQAVLRAGMLYVVYSGRRDGRAMRVEVATHPDQPGTWRIGHFYTRRSLYRVDETGIVPLAAKQDIPLVTYGPLVLMLLVLWIIPGWVLTQALTLRRLRHGPPFAVPWLLIWGGWMRYSTVPLSWEPIIVALRDAGAQTRVPTVTEKRIARLDKRAGINVRLCANGGFIAFVNAGRAQWSALLLLLVGPAALIIAADDLLVGPIDPLLPRLSAATLTGLCLFGVGALVVGWRLLRTPLLCSDANRLAAVLHQAAEHQGCRRVPVQTGQDLKWK